MSFSFKAWNPAPLAHGTARHRFLLALAMTVLLSGCSSLAYYAQAVHGQANVSANARPIPEVLDDAATSPKLRAQLELVQRARAFAATQLALPTEHTFETYTVLDRPYVLWNLFAAPAHAVEPLRWCFPVAGCVAYRGYFSEAAAREAALELENEGYDTHVAGIPTYSTLGWFSDPVLSSFVYYPELYLVAFIFHELAHQVVYVPGDVAFNESFATAVEEEGVRRWFDQTADPGPLREFRLNQQRRREFTHWIQSLRDRLADIYRASDPDARRTEKARLLAAAPAEYAALKKAWGGYAGFDRWMSEGALNNAKLASITLYADWVPAFNAILAAERGALPMFYTRVRELARLPRAEREAQLTAVAERAEQPTGASPLP